MPRASIAGFHQHRHDVRAVHECTEKLTDLATEHGFPFWLATATMLRGWALTQEGHVEEGISQMHQGLAAWRDMGIEFILPFWHTLLAEGYRIAGLSKEGLKQVADGMDQVEKTAEGCWEPELHRLKGDLLLMQGVAEVEIESCFQQALDVSRRQQAKSLELRAAMSMSRLWQNQSKQKEAHKLLSEIYGWFIEGFDTKDLLDAKALMEELS